MSFQFFLQLGVASVLAGILGVRQAFRYRLLNSDAVVLTTAASLVAVASWLAVILWSIVTVGLLKAAIVFISSFVAGNFARWIFGAHSNEEMLSEESLAKSKYEHDVASQRSDIAVGKPEFEDLVQRFDLTSNDFTSLYKAARRMGIKHDTALRAMTDREVVEWYFENVGKDGEFSKDTSLQFTLLIKRTAAE